MLSCGMMRTAVTSMNKRCLSDVLVHRLEGQLILPAPQWCWRIYLVILLNARVRTDPNCTSVRWIGLLVVLTTTTRCWIREAATRANHACRTNSILAVLMFFCITVAIHWYWTKYATLRGILCYFTRSWANAWIDSALNRYSVSMRSLSGLFLHRLVVLGRCCFNFTCKYVILSLA